MELHERLAALRRNLGLTQEEVARQLGVTNQAVSKWESGSCCPDIALLPPLANLLGVSVDQLLGVALPDTQVSLMLRMRNLFQAEPSQQAYPLAQQLASLLHEAAATAGYRQPPHWTVQEDPQTQFNTWGFSADSTPQGLTIKRGAAVFLQDFSVYDPVRAGELQGLRRLLLPLTERGALPVLFALFEAALQDEGACLTQAELQARTGLTAEEVRQALDALSIRVHPGESGPAYQLSGPYRLLPPLLRLAYIPGPET